jgi:hypothetical protein
VWGASKYKCYHCEFFGLFDICTFIFNICIQAFKCYLILFSFKVKGEMIDVKVGWEPKTFKATQVMQINPPKMEKFDDVSNMTYLNEASVLWNLKARYVAKLIYVSIDLHPM